MIKEILFFQKRRLAICERSYASENRPLNVYNVFQNYGETSGVHSANFYNRTCLGIKGTIHQKILSPPPPSEVSYCDKCKKGPRIGTCTHISLNVRTVNSIHRFLHFFQTIDQTWSIPAAGLYFLISPSVAFSATSKKLMLILKLRQKRDALFS